jgi:hypothetical protein
VVLTHHKQSIGWTSFWIHTTYWTSKLFKSLVVWDEKTFSTLTFMKSKLWNWLAEIWILPSTCLLKISSLKKETFPFQVAIMDWNDGDKVRIGVNAWLLGFVVLTCLLWIAGSYFVLFCCWANLWSFWWFMHFSYMGLNLGVYEA